MTPTVLDIAAYQRRTAGLAGRQAAPSLAALAELVQRHLAAIPFENLEVLAGRVPALDLASVQHKLVVQQRGGYCYEQNALFKAVLELFGYTVHALEARVRSGVPAEVATGRTHMALRVTLQGAAYLVDVGFGALSPESPLRLDSREVQVTAGGSAYRLVNGNTELEMHSLIGSDWREGYRVCHSLPTPIDLQMGNWFVATHPQAMLRQNLLVARTAEGRRMTLFNDELTVRRPHVTGGAATEARTRLTCRADFADVLAGEFNLQVDAAELDAVMRLMDQRARASAPDNTTATVP